MSQLIQLYVATYARGLLAWAYNAFPKAAPEPTINNTWVKKLIIKLGLKSYISPKETFPSPFSS